MSRSDATGYLEDIRIVRAMLQELNVCKWCDKPVDHGTGYCVAHLGEARKRASAEILDDEPEMWV